ncbi:unnamed protein product [Didymodactylos carnosus]|uniref:AXH domain-containing protein n=1 Tax=Didymodactylos carnosus TaxID=1234261 RepID=A0A813NWE4_9BILA|nr:unnamed protein product [Didymodactylos carnosus]CAF0751393.1 unnamed protein product [Didymodactylos carnosus]CAF3524853.1 unnamed protein product [Didymodactylos carnosus]CAF3530190.1 unnamed protein product [Didymodactylos carnosus]
MYFPSRQSSVQASATTSTATTSSTMTIETAAPSNIYFSLSSHPLWSSHLSSLPTDISSSYYDQRYVQQQSTDPIFRTPVMMSDVPIRFSFPTTSSHFGLYPNSCVDMYGNKDAHVNQLRAAAATVTSSFEHNSNSSTTFPYTSSHRQGNPSSSKNKLYATSVLGSNTSDKNVSSSPQHHHSTVSNGRHRQGISTNGTFSSSTIDSSGLCHSPQQNAHREPYTCQKSDERQLSLKRSRSPQQNSTGHTLLDGLQTTPANEKALTLKKFREENFIKLGSGEMKIIKELTTNDFIKSADDSDEYSSILACVKDVGVVDNKSGKAQIIFDIAELQKTIVSDVLEEMPFFVYQQTWSSINPNKTRVVCGLECRLLEKGDLIIAVMEQNHLPSILTSVKAISPPLPIPPSLTANDKNTALTRLSPCKKTPTEYLINQYSNENTSTGNYNKYIKNKTDRWTPFLPSRISSDFQPIPTTELSTETINHNVRRKSSEENSLPNTNASVFSSSSSRPSSPSSSHLPSTHKRQKLSSDTSRVQATVVDHNEDLPNVQTKN